MVYITMGLPQIFNEDVSSLVTSMQNRLQTAFGRTFAPADVEMLMINSICYELQLFFIQGNQAVRQNLSPYSSAPMLDLLGDLVGVTRQAATPAVCILQFNLVEGHGVVTIPAGTRVSSIDGQVIFQTDTDVTIPLNVNSTTVTATAQTTGTAGNGYAIGDIELILDPQAYVATCQNLDVTNSGGDEETDDQLRERIKLAPSSFSVAGPTGAYEYWAKTASPTIVDVKCVTTNPGEVTLYILCIGGTLSSGELKNKVLAACSATNIRPQNDTVLPGDPEVIEYSLDVEITNYTGAIDTDILSQANSNLEDYVNAGLNKMGVDVIRSQISAKCMIDMVYNVNVVSPATDLVIADNQYAKCTGINVTIVGSNGG